MVSKKTQRRLHQPFVANTSIHCGAKTTAKQPLCNSKTTCSRVALKGSDHRSMVLAELDAGVSTPNGRSPVGRCVPRNGRAPPPGSIEAPVMGSSAVRGASRHVGGDSRGDARAGMIYVTSAMCSGTDNCKVPCVVAGARGVLDLNLSRDDGNGHRLGARLRGRRTLHAVRYHGHSRRVLVLWRSVTGH